MEVDVVQNVVLRTRKPTVRMNGIPVIPDTQERIKPDMFEFLREQITKFGDLRKLFKNPCSQAELNKIVPFGFSLQRQKNGVFFCH